MTEPHNPSSDDPAAKTHIDPALAGSTVFPQVLQTIGGYEVLEKLGAGGMDAVYRARQVPLGRIVALKVLPVQFIEDAETVSRFHHEAKIAASLTHGSGTGATRN